jgi:hypothetical protein
MKTLSFVEAIDIYGRSMHLHLLQVKLSLHARFSEPELEFCPNLNFGGKMVGLRQ